MGEGNERGLREKKGMGKEGTWLKEVDEVEEGREVERDRSGI